MSVVMAQSAELMMQKAPNARLKEIGGAGHFLMLGNPAEVAREIGSFLDEIGSEIHHENHKERKDTKGKRESDIMHY
jgi:hypothetical protein